MLLDFVLLEDEHVALIPIADVHINELYAAGQAHSLWQWTMFNYCDTLATTKAWVKYCLETARLGSQQTFVIVDKMTNTLVGSTSYLNICVEHKTIEIGATFLTPAKQRSSVNRRSKLLLLMYSFEILKLNRVTLQTHENNSRSRHAILGIGAKFEGIHRDCRIQQNGAIRSSAFYSVIKPEWPQTKANLLAKLAFYL